MIRPMKDSDWPRVAGIHLPYGLPHLCPVGCRERIARDKFGVWQNTTLMERRKKDREP